jgi:hypothetical protein
MKLVPHLVAGLVGVACAGCDIVQGFQDAGDSLFPEQSTHLASPGLRLVSGHYRALGLVGASELYLVARGADDDTNKLFAMRYAEPVPCEIGEVARFSVTRKRTQGTPLFSYFHEDLRRGTLHFADATCRTFSLSFDDARLPLAETPDSVVVWAGSDLWLATPETGQRVRLADDVAEVITGVFGKRYAVRAKGRLTVFDAAWEAQGTFGNDVGSVLRAGESLFYLDALGLHRIVADASTSGVVEDSLFVSDACSLGSQDGTWVALRSPCAGGKVVVIHEPTGKRFELPFDADPQQLQLVPTADSPGLDLDEDPFWFFYVRSGDDESTRDSLFVRTPAGEEHALGAHATLAQLRLVEAETESYGYALVDVDGDTGRYVWWNAAGETRTLAENVLGRPEHLIVDFDGTVGNLAVVSGDRLRVLAEKVPSQAFAYEDGAKDWTVLFHDMQDGIGRLSVLPTGLTELESTPQDMPFDVPELSDVASDVVVLSTLPLNDVLSGVSYLSHFDFTTGTGRLAYRNLELRFTADVHDGVSDYLVSHDELLYNIPYGDDAGIWLVSGK